MSREPRRTEAEEPADEQSAASSAPAGPHGETAGEHDAPADRQAAGGEPEGAADEAAASDAGAAEVEHDIDELLSETRRERDEYLELAQRTRADFENFRRRVASEKAATSRRARGELARELLPAIDNLERALESVRAEADGAGSALADGVAMVLGELQGALSRAGVEGFDPKGEPFDPNLHEAVSKVPFDGVESGAVAETLARGYRIEDEVLRPARVVVAE